jgi:hypothetical protein
MSDCYALRDAFIAELYCGAMLRSLLYVSRSNLPFADRDAVVARIVDVSRRRNAADGITGALIATETHFAQFVEGPADRLDALLARLRRDERHADLDIIRDTSARARRFENWTLAYSGPALFLAAPLQVLVDRTPGADVGDATEDLILLMTAFARIAPEAADVPDFELMGKRGALSGGLG